VACREGIALATDLNIGAVTIASDYLEVVQDLRGGNMGQFGIILREIVNASSCRCGMCFGHEGRRSNVEAHQLAHMATTLPVGRHVWLGTLPEGLNFPVNIVPITD
jgi:hypothetical protein